MLQLCPETRNCNTSCRYWRRNQYNLFLVSRTPKPTLPPFGPNQVTPGFPSSSSSFGQKSQFEVRGQGGFAQGGGGSFGQGGQGQFGVAGQGQAAQGKILQLK